MIRQNVLGNKVCFNKKDELLIAILDRGFQGVLRHLNTHDDELGASQTILKFTKDAHLRLQDHAAGSVGCLRIPSTGISQPLHWSKPTPELGPCHVNLSTELRAYRPWRLIDVLRPYLPHMRVTKGINLLC